MRLSEIYTSSQGEGPGVGDLTQFVRFAGCNLRCPGWPCDTQHAIDPEKYRDEWQTYTPMQVKELIASYPKRVTFTGGEPFLQQTAEMLELFERLTAVGYHIEVFTNGTLPFPMWVQARNVRVIMDWKLPGAGESIKRTEMKRLRNLGRLGEKDAVKFVCASEHDFIEAVGIYHDYWTPSRSMPTPYVGAAWGKVTEAEVVEWLKKVDVPFKLNVQVHNYIWHRDARET